MPRPSCCHRRRMRAGFGDGGEGELELLGQFAAERVEMSPGAREWMPGTRVGGPGRKEVAHDEGRWRFPTRRGAAGGSVAGFRMGGDAFEAEDAELPQRVGKSASATLRTLSKGIGRLYVSRNRE